MKIFRIGDTIPLNGVGFGSTDIRYIQEGSTEAFAALIKMKLPLGYNQPVILDGIVVTKVGTNYTHTAGHIYYQGYIHTVDERTIQLASPGGSPQWQLQEVYHTDNPVAFADGFTYNIDVDLKITLVNSAGTGIVAYDAIRRLEHIEFNQSKELYELITIPKLPYADFLTDNFDVGGLGKPYTKYEGFSLSTGANDSVDMQGIVAMGFNFTASALTNVRGVGDYLSVAIGNLYGKMKHLLTSGESGLRNHAHKTYIDPFGNSTVGQNDGGGAGYIVMGNSPDGVTQLFTQNSGASDAADEHENRQPSRLSIMIMKVEDIAA